VSRQRPLAGRRILVTRPRGRSRELCRELARLGARVVSLPLIEVEYPPRNPALEAELRALESYDWIAFTSPHGVVATIRGLRRIGRDAAALRCARVAAVGPGTAAALGRHGLRADVVGQPSTGEGLARVLRRAVVGPASILHPGSDRAGHSLSTTLAAAGHRVREVVAYRTVAVRTAAGRRAAHADAVIVCSPSAVAQLRAQRIGPPRAVLACIGPVTAKAARALGLRVGAVARRPTARALAAAAVRALAEAR
jgi:uroporphyrinogen-III synthase